MRGNKYKRQKIPLIENLIGYADWTAYNAEERLERVQKKRRTPTLTVKSSNPTHQRTNYQKSALVIFAHEGRRFTRVLKSGGFRATTKLTLCSLWTRGGGGGGGEQSACGDFNVHSCFKYPEAQISPSDFFQKFILQKFDIIID